VTRRRLKCEAVVGSRQIVPPARTVLHRGFSKDNLIGTIEFPSPPCPAFAKAMADSPPLEGEGT
jgi:hypothetical protein